MSTLTSEGMTSIDRRGSSRRGKQMPYVIEKRGGQFCVFKQGEDGEATGDTHGCHATYEDARQQQKALYAAMAREGKDARKDAEGAEDFAIYSGGAVKAMGAGKIRVSLVPFTTAEDPDTDGEFFDAQTDFDRDFPAKMSLWWAHGVDETIRDRKLGRVEVKSSDADLWFEHQLDLSDDYEAKIYRLAELGRLGGSSGAVSHLVRKTPVGKSVHIDRWPIGDASILVTPAHPATRGRTVALKSLDPVSVEEALSAPARSHSLAENTDRWLDSGMEVLSGYTSIAAKAGRKLSAARRNRLTEMRQMIDDLLSETEPQEAASVDDNTPPPGMGEGAGEKAKTGLDLPVISVLDLDDLYASAVRQHDHGMSLGG